MLGIIRLGYTVPLESALGQPNPSKIVLHKDSSDAQVYFTTVTPRSYNNSYIPN